MNKEKMREKMTRKKKMCLDEIYGVSRVTLQVL